MTKKYVFGVLLNIAAIIFFFVPFAILFIVRYDSWVTTETTKISVGVMLGLFYAILVLRGALKQMSPKLTTIISMGVFLALLWFFDSIINDLFFIVFSVMIGYILFIGLNSWGKRQIEIAKIYKDETVRVVARTTATTSSTSINSI
jgi:hypothetical protein